MPQQSSPKPLKDPLEPPKALLGEPWDTPRSTLPAALGPPEGLPGAAKAKTCKRLQREHQLRPPSQSTLDPLSHPAPPALNLPLTLPAHRSLLPAPAGPPPPPDPGVGGLTGLRPLPPTPKRGSRGQQ